MCRRSRRCRSLSEKDPLGMEAVPPPTSVESSCGSAKRGLRQSAKGTHVRWSGPPLDTANGGVADPQAYASKRGGGRRALRRGGCRVVRAASSALSLVPPAFVVGGRWCLSGVGNSAVGGRGECSFVGQSSILFYSTLIIMLTIAGAMPPRRPLPCTAAPCQAVSTRRGVTFGAGEGGFPECKLQRTGNEERRGFSACCHPKRRFALPIQCVTRRDTTESDACAWGQVP